MRSGELLHNEFDLKHKQHLHGPALKGGDSEKSHHGHEDIVKVKVTVVPDPLLNQWQRCVPVIVENVSSPRIGKPCLASNCKSFLTHTQIK